MCSGSTKLMALGLGAGCLLLLALQQQLGGALAPSFGLQSQRWAGLLAQAGSGASFADRMLLLGLPAALVVALERGRRLRVRS